MDIEVASILWNRGARPLPLIDRPQYEIGKERRGERNLCLPVVGAKELASPGDRGKDTICTGEALGRKIDYL